GETGLPGDVADRGPAAGAADEADGAARLVHARPRASGRRAAPAAGAAGHGEDAGHGLTARRPAPARGRPRGRGLRHDRAAGTSARRWPLSGRDSRTSATSTMAAPK